MHTINSFWDSPIWGPCHTGHLTCIWDIVSTIMPYSKWPEQSHSNYFYNLSPFWVGLEPAVLRLHSPSSPGPWPQCNLHIHRWGGATPTPGACPLPATCPALPSLRAPAPDITHLCCWWQVEGGMVCQAQERVLRLPLDPWSGPGLPMAKRDTGFSSRLCCNTGDQTNSQLAVLVLSLEQSNDNTHYLIWSGDTSLAKCPIFAMIQWHLAQVLLLKCVDAHVSSAVNTSYV